MEHIDTRSMEEIIIDEESNIDITKDLILEIDAKNIVISKLGNDTHIGYDSPSHPNKYCIEVVQGHWIQKDINKNILTLIKE